MHRFQSVAAFFLIVVIVVAPLPLGSNRDWAWAPLAALVGLGLLFSTAAHTGRSTAPSIPAGELAFPILAMAITVAWGLAQTIQWSFLPESNVFLASAADALGRPPAHRVAMDVERDLTGIMRLLAYCGVFWLSAQLGRDTRFARRMLWGLVVSAVLVTLYGFAMQVDNRSCVVIDVVKLPIGSSCAFSGTFINSDNYATFAGLAAIICMAELQFRFMRAGQASDGPRQRLRARIGILSGTGGLLGGALIVLFGGVVLSGSKAGTLALLGTCLTVILMLNAARPHRSKAAMASVVFFAVFALAIVAVSGEMLVTRLVALVKVGDVDRSALFFLSLAAIALRPWAGWGFGSFDSAFSVLQPIEVIPFYDKAHNAYLESAVDFGIPVASLFIAGIAFVAFRCALGIFRRSRDEHYPAMGMGAALFVALHSLFDFSIQIPAVAIAFSALLGLGWAQSRSSRQP